MPKKYELPAPQPNDVETIMLRIRNLMTQWHTDDTAEKHRIEQALSLVVGTMETLFPVKFSQLVSVHFHPKQSEFLYEWIDYPTYIEEPVPLDDFVSRYSNN